MLNQLQYGDVLVSAKDASQHLIASAKPLHGFIQVVCERTGSSQFHLYEQLKRDIATGLYRIKRKGSPKHSPLQQGDAQLDATQSRALSLCNQIKQYMHKYGVSERRAYQALTESHEGRPSVTLSTVYRYMQRLRHGLPPLRGAKNKGPRSRIQLEDRTLVCQLACQYYLEPSSRYSTSAFVKHVNEALRAPREGVSEERRKQLATSLSRKAILGIIRRNITRTEDKERMQPELRQAAFSIATKKIRVSGPLMRVEQDALHLPFQVATPDGISSNVYVVHCIDAYSGVVLGWSLSIGTPDVQATLRCLEKALFPKREILGEYGISTPNDYFGTPAEIVFDNGPENHGASAKTLPSDILCALDSPVSMRGTTASQLNALMEKQLQLAGTKVLLLDEANHLTDEGKRITLRAAADWLKCLMDGLGISIVLSGIPRLNALLESNEQLYLRARPASYYMPYDASQEADYNAFAALIWEYMSRFQNVGYPIEINDEEFIADCLMFSGGLVGVVHKFFVNLLHVLKGAKPRGVTLEDSQRALAMTATLAPENCTAFGQKAADPVRQRLVYARVLKANAMPEPTLF
ncbi:TniB family NTP-binding protein [Comamonas aquatica]|uniref:TniB family NTP-binding protein n=1 Tax=Comamonas aquatica TaxID=225991 RepID=UPI00244BEB01|nr:TniB family NTP-binding protein [Comamonas aquatica]MDH1902998.1 TniB family NTP-binding protein [Comamonas aquatica]